MKLSNAAFLLVTTVSCIPSLYASMPASASSSSAVGSEEKSVNAGLLTAEKIKHEKHMEHVANQLSEQRHAIAQSILEVVPSMKERELSARVQDEINARITQACASPSAPSSVMPSLQASSKLLIMEKIKFEKWMNEAINRQFNDCGEIAIQILEIDPSMDKAKLISKVKNEIHMRLEQEGKNVLSQNGNSAQEDEKILRQVISSIGYSEKIERLFSDASEAYGKERIDKYVQQFKKTIIGSNFCGLKHYERHVCSRDLSDWEHRRYYEGAYGIAGDCRKGCVRDSLFKNGQADWEAYKQDNCGIQ